MWFHLKIAQGPRDGQDTAEPPALDCTASSQNALLLRRGGDFVVLAERHGAPAAAQDGAAVAHICAVKSALGVEDRDARRPTAALTQCWVFPQGVVESAASVPHRGGEIPSPVCGGACDRWSQRVGASQRDIGAVVSVKNGDERAVSVISDVEVGGVGVFHCLAPPLHCGGTDDEACGLEDLGHLFADGFCQHFYLLSWG
jgi:hypothetical protein